MNLTNLDLPQRIYLKFIKKDLEKKWFFLAGQDKLVKQPWRPL
jgi:hypothetical protein